LRTATLSAEEVALLARSLPARGPGRGDTAEAKTAVKQG